MDATNLNVDGMTQGVLEAENVLFFLNDMALTRKFVLIEIRRAISVGKKIVIVTEKENSHGALLCSDGSFDLRRVLIDQPLELQLDPEV